MTTTIYSSISDAEPLSQGDVIDDCPVAVDWAYDAAYGTYEAFAPRERVVILTQACDLLQPRATGVLVAVVHSAQKLVERGIVKANVVRDHIRAHRVYGWYFLPKGDLLDESLVNLRDLHTVPRSILDDLVVQGKRVCRVTTPFREHMAQHFSITYSRIGLPAPYETE